MSAEWRKGAKAALGGSAAWFVNAMRTAVFYRLPKAALTSVPAKRISACEKGAKELWVVAPHGSSMPGRVGSGRGSKNHRFSFTFLLKHIDFESRAGSGAAGIEKPSIFF